MATFNQQNQRVRHQVNGEHVYMGADGNVTQVQVERMIDALVERLHAEHERPDIAETALVHVEAARGASQGGDRPGVVALLSKAAEVAAPVAVLASSVAAVVDLVMVWHD